MGSVEQAVEELRGQVLALSAEVRELRAANESLREAAVGRDSGDEAASDRPMSRRGMFAAAAGAAGGMLLAQAAPAAAANGDPVKLGELNTATAATTIGGSMAIAFLGATSQSDGIGVQGLANTSGYGVWGSSSGPAGIGVYGAATSTTGITYGVRAKVLSPDGAAVYGRSESSFGPTKGVSADVLSTQGTAVYGNAQAASGPTCGIFGTASSPSGWGVYCQGRFKATGRSFLAAPNGAPNNNTLDKGMISFYLDQANNKLKVRVKYSTGTVKTATIALA